MALLDALRVVVVVLISSALVGLCQDVVLLPERPSLEESGTSSRETAEIVHDLPTVRSVSVKHVVARGEKLESSILEKRYDSDKGVEAESWGSEFSDHRVIGKRNRMVPRAGRSLLRTTKRSAYACNLPPGACKQPNERCCGSACVAVSSNPSHCGRCGHMCSAKRVCCGGKCRRLATDEKNCGRCGLPCATGIKCLFGLCGYS